MASGQTAAITRPSRLTLREHSGDDFTTDLQPLAQSAAGSCVAWPWSVPPPIRFLFIMTPERAKRSVPLAEVKFQLSEIRDP